MIDLPLPKRFEAADVPKRLAQLVGKSRQKPPLPPPPVVEEPRRTRPSRRSRSRSRCRSRSRPRALPQPDEPLYAAAEPARRPAESAKAGILAFRDKFAGLAQGRSRAAARRGCALQRYRRRRVQRTVGPRSMLTSNAPGSSGGINLASLSRNVGGGGGGGVAAAAPAGVQGVEVGRATSSIGGGGGGGARTGRWRAAARDCRRTDEEIQIVFDRYKAALYRLYNRELRNDPTLRGQMVLRLTIEPDGSVSMCELQATDMNAPELSAQVVDRVRTINFGAKDGVS
jgi:hypothetical protein